MSFQWTYYDGGSGEGETQYQLQVYSSDPDSAEINISRTVSPSLPNGTVNTEDNDGNYFLVNPFNAVSGGGYLTYGKTYNIRIKVWNIYGESDWENLGTYTTPANSLPNPSFNVNPSNAAPGRQILFADSSICRKSDNSAYNCKTQVNGYVNYIWDFGDSYCNKHPLDAMCKKIGDNIYSYSSGNIYNTQLQVCDSMGCCDAPHESVTITSGSHCDSSSPSKCTANGHGKECSSDPDCSGQQPVCNASNKCVIGGTGCICDTVGSLGDSQCGAYSVNPTCNSAGQCIACGGGAVCSLANNLGDGRNSGCVPSAINLSHTPPDCSNEVFFNWQNYNFTASTDSRIYLQVTDTSDSSVAISRVICGTDTTSQYSDTKMSNPIISATMGCDGIIYAYPDVLLYGKTYRWKVKICNNASNCSAWIIEPSVVTTSAHSFPDVKFTNIASAVVGSSVKFTDNSKCYNSPTGNCKDASGVTYTWSNVNNNPAIHTVGDITSNAYSSAGEFSPSLMITDDVGTCSANGSLEITKKGTLPGWKEINPF